MNQDNTPDINDLRSLWQKCDVRIDTLEKRNAELTRQLRAQRLTSQKSKVVRNYRLSGIVGISSPAWLLPATNILPLSTLTIVSYLIFMLVFGSLSLWFSHYISKTDFYSLPVADAVRRMLRIDTIRHRAKMTGWICCIPVAALLFMDMAINSFGLFGGIVGGIIGAAIGLGIDRRNRRIIRDIAASLDSPDESC